MAFPQVQNVGSDGVILGVSGAVPVTGAVSLQAGAAVTVSAGSVVVTNGSVTITQGAGLAATAAVSNASVAGTTAFVSVKVGSGRIFGMTMATSGQGVVTVTDGSGGTVIAGLASTQTAAAPETFPTIAGGVPFTTALVVVGTASSPNVTVHFS